jgi:hypothetical protein
VDAIRKLADVSGSRRFEVLIPRLRRRGLLAEIESHCAAAGVQCEEWTDGEGSGNKGALILTVPAGVNAAAFAKLSSWIYVRVGTRPYDLSEAASAAVRRREPIDAIRADNAWTSRDFEFAVGRMVRTEFLAGVGSICVSTGARWEWHVERRGLTRTIVVIVSGPGSVVDKTVSELVAWQRRFAPLAGG